MKIDFLISETGNDFTAIMACEHCDAKWTNHFGYHDRYYHTQVIPAMFCPCCGKNRAGDTEPKEAT